MREMLGLQGAANPIFGLTHCELWAAATIQRDKRLELDPWDDVLENLQADVYPSEDGKQGYRISSNEIFVNWLQVPRNKRTATDASHLKHVMNRLGWQGPTVSTSADPARNSSA